MKKTNRVIVIFLATVMMVTGTDLTVFSVAATEVHSTENVFETDSDSEPFDESDFSENKEITLSEDDSEPIIFENEPSVDRETFLATTFGENAKNNPEYTTVSRETYFANTFMQSSSSYSTYNILDISEIDFDREINGDVVITATMSVIPQLLRKFISKSSRLTF